MAFYGLLLVSVIATVFGGRKALLYAAAFVMPLVEVMPQPLGTFSTPINLIVLGLAGGLILHPEIRRPASERAQVRRSIMFLCIMLMVGLAIRGIGDLTGETHVMPFSIAAKSTWRCMIVFVFYRLAFRISGGGFDAPKALTLCQLSILMQAAIAVFERVSGTGRGSASFGEANMAGSYFASGSAFFLAWFLMDSSIKKWLFFGSWLVCVFSLFVTLSRGGMVAASVAGTVVLVLFYFGAGRKMGTKVIFLLILVLMILNFSLLVPQWVKERVLFTFTQNSEETADVEKLDDGSEERLLFWRTSGELYRTRPFGWGAFTFPQLMSQYFKAKQTHNIYLQILVEFGTQGLLALSLLVLTVYGSLFKRFRRHEDEWKRALALSLVGWWTGHVVAHFFVNSFFLMEVSGQFWLMVTLLDTQSARAPASAGQERTPWRTKREIGSRVTLRVPRSQVAGSADFNATRISGILDTNRTGGSRV